MWCCSRTAKLLFNSVLGYETDETSSSTNSTSNGSAAKKKRGNDILLDSAYLGHEVVVVKNGLRICGTGGALGSASLMQTKSYFEVKFQQEGVFGIGIATRNCLMESGPLGNDAESWVLRQTGELFHNQVQVGKLDNELQEGDIIGVSYDHIELNFFVNGVKCNTSFSNIRGTVYPGFYVDEGAVLDVMFDDFSYPPPSGFDRIMKEKSIL